MDIPLFSGSLLQNQCQGKWRLSLEKASKSLTVIVVNSSPVPGSFIYCKSLHLPELLTSKGFYCSPLRASLMCATMYFNINILHMYRNIYSKQWKNDCWGCLGVFAFVVEEIELLEWTRKGNWMHWLWCGELRTHVSWSYKQTLKDNSYFSHFLSSNICPATKFYKSLHNISRITKERANQAEWLQMENKRRHKIFQAPSGCLFERLLKCLLKRWFVCGSAMMWPCQHVSGSSAGPVTCERVPWKRSVYTCGTQKTPP